MSNSMNFVSYRCLVFMSFSVVMLVTVNGQSTIDRDYDFHDYEISKLIDTVADLRYRMAKLEGSLASAINEAQSKPDASKTTTFYCSVQLI